MNKNHFKYRTDIDGLRAIAILLVIIFHAYPKFLSGGFIGVDIFFVISGYLITSIIFKALDKDKFSLINFYSRRIKRIFPALITVLIFCLGAGWFILLPNEYESLGKHISGGAAYVSNFILQDESGYFDIDSKLKPLLHLWSLSIEEQFYFIFPLILIISIRAKLNFLLIIVLLFSISFSLNIYQIQTNVSKAFYFPHTRFWELLLGSLVAYINLYKRNNFNLALHRLISNKVYDKLQFEANIMAWLGFLLICIGWIGFDYEKISYPSSWALIPTLGAAFLIFASEKAWLNRKVLASKFMVVIGLISYPLYLWHWPLLSFTHIVQMEKPSSILRFLVLTLTFILAWMTYYFIEKKLRYRDHWTTPVGLITCMLIIGLLGYQVFNENGYAERMLYKNQLAEDFGDKPWQKKGWIKQDSCQKKFGNFEMCLIQDNAAPPTAMLIGDSHANHLYPGLKDKPSITGGNLLNLSIGSCLHFINNSKNIFVNQKRHCQSLVDKEIKEAINIPSVHRVFLAGFWNMYLEQKKGKIIQIFSQKKMPNKIKDFEESMRETLVALSNANKEIIFVMDVPELSFSPKNCLPRPWRISGKLVREPCAISRTDFDNQSKIYKDIVTKVLTDFPKVKVLDPTDLFCDNQYCWAMKSGKLLYRDSNHLNEYGSYFFAKGIKF